MDIMLAIKPKYSQAILSGAKTIELRRKPMNRLCVGQEIFLYETFPTKAVVGCATVNDWCCLTLNNLWEVVKNKACISKQEFDEYFSNNNGYGFAVELVGVKKFDKTVTRNRLLEFDLKTPQSFRYLNFCQTRAIVREASR